MAEKNNEGALISVILRIAVASLFVAAVVPKFLGGVGNMPAHFQKMFEGSWLPMPLVMLHAQWVPWIEMLLPVWLVAGWKLRWAWTAAALFMTTLAFGMAVAGKGDVAAANFTYVLICCAGLYFSRFDRFGLEALGKGACCGGGCH